MKFWMKGMIVALVHLLLVSSLGAKLLYDRSVRPRVWAETVPYDPDLPIRGRYVRLQVMVKPEGFELVDSLMYTHRYRSVTLNVEQETLVATATDESKERFHPSDLQIDFLDRDSSFTAILATPLAFFIPEHIPDPSIRPEGETLWVEVTLPKRGPPRPIQLGIKSGDGPIVPMDIN